ncbi:hypothetical protein H8E77_41815 [bacterium]|nr:hypothetical protein [bacterium]
MKIQQWLKFWTFGVTCILALVIAGLTYAGVFIGIQNPSFETGDTTNWTETLPGGGSMIWVLTEHTGNPPVVYGPTQGNYLALLVPGTPGQATTLTQDFTINAGQTLEGYAVFESHGQADGTNDYASVRILQDTTEIDIPWYNDENTVGKGQSDPSLDYWSWIAPSSDTYTLEYSITNDNDPVEPGPIYSSHVMFDTTYESTLPVTLSMLTAVRSQNDVALRWRTETEVNNIGFTIYRSKVKDGKFVKIGFVKGAGSTGMPTDYEFVDKTTKPGQTYFYYLEDIDVEGIKTKSKVVMSRKPINAATTWGKLKKS